MSLIAATFAIALQNPESPYVTIPDSWKRANDYGRRFSLIGPEGQTIYYSGYTPTGYVATVYYEIEPDSLPFRAIIGVWEVYFAACPDGKIAISYQNRPGASLGGRFDFWMKARSVREAFQLVSICLTRPAGLIEHYPTDAALSAPKVIWGDTSKDSLFPGLGAGYHTPFRRDSMSFELPSGDRVTIGGEPPEEIKWREHATILNFSLEIAEDASGKAWIVRTGGALQKAVATMSKPTVPGVLLAMLAALKYQKQNAGD